MEINKAKTANAGMALLTALIFISVAVLMLGTVLMRNMNETLVVDRYQHYKNAMQGINAAIETSRVELEAGEDGIVGWGDFEPQFNQDNSMILPDPEEGGLEFLHNTSTPDVEYCSYAIPWFTDGRDSNGDGTIDSTLERFTYTVYALAKEQGTVRKVEAVFKGQDVNVWRNAIFAGTGQAGGLINGNVSIHGSVHLLGDDLLEGDAAIAAIELSGTSLIHNNYEGLPADLAARVPALDQITFEGESVGTLEANLRVKNGLVSLSGNSEIGEPQQLMNSYKETMDGTYVTDGWTGNAVTDDGDRGDPTSVWSDNGWDTEYDVGDKVPFPMLGDDWRDPGDGHKIADPDTGAWYTHEDYFSEVLLADPDVQVDGVYVGDITLDAGGSNFYWNATTGEKLTGAAAATASPGVDDDYLWFKKSGGGNNDPMVLISNGQLRIEGNLTLTGSGNKKTINYSGRSAILTYGDITVDANLVTCNNGDPTNTANSFPVNNVIGLMASENMYVGTTSQLSIMGAFYAQKMIRSEKQTNIMGTFVSNYFDMGTNVPSIFQVPTLADNLPLGMIGNYPIFSLSQVSWREI